MDKNKIIFFHPENDYTGSTRVLANLIESEYSSEAISIVTYNPGKGFFNDLPNVKIYNTWQPTVRNKPIKFVSYVIWVIYASLLALIVGRRYGVFYINTTQPFYAAIVGKLLKKKIIYHVHEVFPLNNPTRRLLRKVFDNTPSHRIFVSYYTKSQYSEMPNSTWEVKYNKLSRRYLDNIVIRPLSERRCNSVLMIAALTEAKGVRTFINIAALMPQYSFTLVLSAPMDDIKIFFGNTIPTNVALVPVQSDVKPFIMSTDLLLCLSIPSMGVETFGMTILEAMPYGVPAIVPNVGGPTELVKDGFNGYCVDVTNEREVVDKISKAFEEGNYFNLCNNTLKQFEKFS